LAQPRIPPPWSIEFGPDSVVIRAIIPKSVLAKLEKRAAAEGYTLSSLIRLLLTRATDEQE
jgi:hypothetical protein